MTVEEWGKAIAEEVARAYRSGEHRCAESCDLDHLDLDAIIASVEKPAPDVQAQIDAAYERGYANGERDTMQDNCNAIDAAVQKARDQMLREFAGGMKEHANCIDAAVARERDRVTGIFVGELQKLHENTVLDCGDNSCLFATRRGGMRTNGGCRCIERLLDAAVAREREDVRGEAELLLHQCDEGTLSVSAALDRLVAEIRARSGARGV